MKKVTCTRPNASGNINGIDFELIEGARVATVDDALAAQFGDFPGYVVEDAEPAKTAEPAAGRGRGGRKAADAKTDAKPDAAGETNPSGASDENPGAGNEVKNEGEGE